MKKTNLDTRVLYISFHNLIKKKFGIKIPVHRKYIYSELGRHFLIPKNLRIVVLKEMEEMKLIKIVDRDNIIVLDCKLDLKEDAHSFFKKVNLF